MNNELIMAKIYIHTDGRIQSCKWGVGVGTGFWVQYKGKAIICVRTWNNENDKENLINYN